MKLLADASLERSPIVANSRMNRSRRAVGTNSYTKELGHDPIAFLAERIQSARSTSWLDLCCGRGVALVETAENLCRHRQAHNITLHGVDLVSFFDDIPHGMTHLRLESATVHEWKTTEKYDLITCVHGLHYVGDKLSLVERAVNWLTADGMFLSNLDLVNLRLADGRPLGRRIDKRFRDCGLAYNHRRHLLTCSGAKSLSLGYQYVGADDAAGPNYSGQEAVDSYYEPRDCF